jgi:hypothetical protein
MHLALKIQLLPFWFKFLCYLGCLVGISVLPPHGVFLVFVFVPLIGLIYPAKYQNWLKSTLRFLPIAVLPLVAWVLTSAFHRNVLELELALAQGLGFWLLFLLSDVFSHLVSALEIHHALRIFPSLATAAALFLTYLAWLRQELDVLWEAQRLRGNMGWFHSLGIRAKILLSLIVRGMEHAQDKGDAIYLRLGSE